MHVLDFVAVVAATGALVNAWLHEDGLFEDIRDAIATWGEPSAIEKLSKGKLTLYANVREKLAKLLQCHMCLSYHAAFWLLVLFYLPSLWLSPPWCVVWRLPIYALAATRLSLFIDDNLDGTVDANPGDISERENDESL